MDLSEIRRHQSTLASRMERMVASYIEETGMIPVIEISCIEHRTIGGSLTHVPVVKVYSVLPEVPH
jgi:hypothetical protein